MEPQQDIAIPEAAAAELAATESSTTSAAAPVPPESTQALADPAQPASVTQNSASAATPQITTNSEGSLQSSNNAASDEQSSLQDIPPGLAHLTHIGFTSKRNSTRRGSTSGQPHSDKISLEQFLRFDPLITVLECKTIDDLDRVLLKIEQLQTAVRTRRVVLEKMAHTMVKGSILIALDNYVAQTPDELSFQKGETLTFLEADSSGWACASKGDTRGWFPVKLVELKPVELAAAPSPVQAKLLQHQRRASASQHRLSQDLQLPPKDTDTDSAASASAADAASVSSANANAASTPSTSAAASAAVTPVAAPVTKGFTPSNRPSLKDLQNGILRPSSRSSGGGFIGARTATTPLQSSALSSESGSASPHGGSQAGTPPVPPPPPPATTTAAVPPITAPGTPKAAAPPTSRKGTGESVDTTSITSIKNMTEMKLANWLGNARPAKEDVEEKNILMESVKVAKKEEEKKKKRDLLSNLFSGKKHPGGGASDESSEKEVKEKKEKKDKEKEHKDKSVGGKGGDSPMFGVPLDKVLELGAKEKKKSAKSAQSTFIPFVVMELVRYLTAKPDRLTAEGIFRISAQQSELFELRARFQSASESIDLEAHCPDVHTAAALLKNFFSSLPEPLFPFPFYDEINKYLGTGNPEPKGAKEIVEKLPPINRLTLGFLMAYLNRVCSFSTQNKMTHANMGIVWGPNLIRPKNETAETMMRKIDSRFIEELLTNHDFVFGQGFLKF